MLKHYLIITLRGLSKDRIFSVINILGLSIAIACCFLLLFWVKFELSFEDTYPNAHRTYKLIETENRKDGIHHNVYMRDMTKKLKNTFPQISAATVVVNEYTSLTREGDEGDGIMLNYTAASPDFLRIFAYEYVEGSPQGVIQEGGCIITEEAARKVFGDESPVGKKLMRFMDGYTISAVVKMPANTQVRFDILNVNARVMDSGSHYIMLEEGTPMTRALEKQLSEFLSTLGDTKNTLTVQPLKDVHLHSPQDITTIERFGFKEIYGNYAQIIFFTVAVLLILLMAIINYINTSIARAMNRMKEVGVRKVTGATRRNLVERFLFESFIISLIAVFVSLVFTKYIFPEFSEIMGNKIALSFDWQTIVIAIAVCILISILSGGYAAFYLSSYNPASILKGGSKSGSKERMRKALVGLQFFLSISILVSTVFIYKQITAIFNDETGMSRKNIIVLDTNLWYEAEDYINIIKKENPNVIDATIANCPPYNAPWSHTGVTWEGKPEDLGEMAFTQIFCDHNYAGTFGLEVLQGEFIPSGLSWWQDSDDKSFDIVVNESFVKLMDVDNPLGYIVSYGYAKGRIIGVVKDFNFKPLKEPVAPLFMSFNPEASTKLYVKTTGRDKQQTLEYILAKYKEMKPDWANRPVMYHTVEDEYNKMYEDELRTLKVLSVFSVISFLLSLMGVISMVSFMIEKRTKEIAIRKINGAGIVDIVKLFCKDILKIACVAAVLSIPTCYILMSKWLEGYVYRTTLSWWVFLLVPLCLMVITSLVVGLQVWLTARKRPVDSLRSE
ncbi:FtsX-like permease family protein [Dysgonomonas sp. 25]|uniref:FtsX-like permease family protein n=1 Tax=Dysgonomonas sp. 25 TaxID=2302933 RepID=UPI0013D8CAE7|nr:FtsX-like permease family protein [Dysgonomonas sp. 25]NDV68830.1 hypothetical protein [Dysgonomonas sp. 25]